MVLLIAVAGCSLLTPSAQDYFDAGRSADANSNLSLAIQDFTQAIRLDPSDAKAYFHRGNVYFELGDLDRAAQDYAQAINLNPQYAEAYRDRGRTYVESKNWQQALADLEKYLELAPNAPDRRTITNLVQQARSSVSP